ncbi:MAG: 50S ribosomal protein L13 [Candidatus Dasytiphilus stammeri]
MKTFMKKKNNVTPTWYLIDANCKNLGRLASFLAMRLRGKHYVEYTPHLDMGDYIIVINAEKVIITGKKYDNKIYYYHTGYIGHLKKNTFKDLMKRHPSQVIEKAVQGMLPKGPLGRLMFRKLKVYAGNKHFHTAQKPNPITLDI